MYRGSGHVGGDRITSQHVQLSEHIGKIPNKSHAQRKRACDGDKNSLKEVMKGVWGMPWLSEAKKDVISCDKLRGTANRC